MNPNTQFERDLEQWLRTEAPASAPAGFHASVMDRARTLRQRPGWATSLPARRLGRGRGLTLLAAAALVGGGALAAGSGLLRLPSVVPPVPEPSVVAVATTSPDATSTNPSESAAPSASPIPVAGPGGVWLPTGSMVTPRSGHDAVRLLDGRVLVVGGTANSSGPELTSAEIYDPASGTWSATGSMLKPRYGFPATLLLDGRVLVGDRDDSTADEDTWGSEVYDPESGTWSSSGTVFTKDFGGAGSTATLLRDGKVLVYGPSGGQLYDPDGGTWSATGTMITPRHNHTATLLSDGKVLAAGGSCHVLACSYAPAGEAELYDPDAGSWTAIPNSTLKPSPRFGWWASLMQDGTLLLMADSTKLYDPTTGTWSTLAVPPEPYYPKALLPDDTVLMAVEGPSCTAAAIYDPRSGSWMPASSMVRCESAEGQPPLFTLLRDGTVLAAGGNQCNGDGVCVSSGSPELYVPAGVSLPPFDFPTPSPIDFPSPTPRPTPLPPAAGPVPPNARSWTVTVDNRSPKPAALFVADEDGDGLRLVGAATPNVVPAGASVNVTFLFPPDGGWIYVNPRPGERGGLVNADDIGIPGKVVVTADGQVGWLSP